ncbi:uncharacterized protein LOC121983144 [Zingiber officinale]|uniref:Uncharacterized protein n=1 Tax=Zingiber officinale TaxID=94328 RepID=A0A8J5LCB0_ZINOF|nr:uncharacterized protein LOC121983144 [Zingiber officinale]KAG6507862.1 hypothetical protein ZIOFF_033215 [Zingiber officinale]
MAHDRTQDSYGELYTAVTLRTAGLTWPAFDRYENTPTRRASGLFVRCNLALPATPARAVSDTSCHARAPDKDLPCCLAFEGPSAPPRDKNNNPGTWPPFSSFIYIIPNFLHCIIAAYVDAIILMDTAGPRMRLRPAAALGRGRRGGKGGKGRHGHGIERRRVRELRRLVPGGRRLPEDQLFVRTADYIFRLRLRVEVLTALYKVYMP